MHAHGHDHGEARDRSARRLGLALVLVAGYMVAEVVGGLLANSLALLADAGHMLSDAAALGISLFAIWMARRPPTPERTYGFHRVEVLAALVNGAALLAVSGWICWEAWHRFAEPPEVQGGIMMGVAAGGLAVNLAGLAILSGGRSESLNVRGAWLHVVTDSLGSVAAVVGGLLVWTLDWRWTDPVLSVLIAVLVIYSGWNLLREVVAVLMEGTPRHIDIQEVRAAIMERDGVQDVHDLHVWTITTGMEALSGHVVVAEDGPHADLLRELRDTLHDRFDIGHVTLQIEPVGFDERQPVCL